MMTLGNPCWWRSESRFDQLNLASLKGFLLYSTDARPSYDGLVPETP